MTLVSLHMFRNMPVLKNLSRRLDREIKISSLIVLIIFVEMLLGPLLLLLLRVLIVLLTPLGVVEDILYGKYF